MNTNTEKSVDLTRFRKKVADSFLFTVNLYEFYERERENSEVFLNLIEFVRMIDNDDDFAEKLFRKCIRC